MVEQVNDHYNLRAIRQLLLAAFTAEDLRRLCLDRSIFRPIVHNFGPKYNLNDMVDEVLFYRESRDLLDQLVAAVREMNPRQYRRFEASLHDPGYTPPSSSQDQPLLPLRKIGEYVKQAVVGDAEAARALRNRQAMLQLVRNTWIKGVLEQSLHGATMIELGMEERADVVERPWDVVVQMPGERRQMLPHGTRLVDIFDDTGQSLLILGEPGSGKTTMLLELARDTIARAEGDPTEPLPVVFNLSSWTEKKLTITAWLVEELNTKYRVPKKIASAWIEQDELLLLLDGLDEVRVDWRNACVQAVNRFRGEHLMPMVVVSRTADYNALATRINLHSAVLLQPLSPEQVGDYLASAGDQTLAVRTLLGRDSALQEFAESPLMLRNEI